jgi:hypothetical protein
MKTLFIGGPRDGIREELPPHILGATACYQTLEARPAYRDGYPTGYPAEINLAPHIKTHMYHLKQFNESNETFQIAVHSSVTNPMRRLFNGYRYPKRKKY